MTADQIQACFNVIETRCFNALIEANVANNVEELKKAYTELSIARQARDMLENEAGINIQSTSTNYYLSLFSNTISTCIIKMNTLIGLQALRKPTNESV